MKTANKKTKGSPGKKKDKPKGHQLMSKKAIQNKISGFSKEIIEKLLDEMRNGDNSNARIGAAKTLLNKVLPDLKATDITSDGDKIQGIDASALLEKAYGSKSGSSS